MSAATEVQLLIEGWMQRYKALCGGWMFAVETESFSYNGIVMNQVQFSNQPDISVRKNNDSTWAQVALTHTPYVIALVYDDVEEYLQRIEDAVEAFEDVIGEKIDPRDLFPS